MLTNPCRLCGLVRELKNSHFIPAAFYKTARASDPDGENPVIVTKHVAIQTSKQAVAPLLCGECEDRFNKNGEKWTLARCWQADGTFPLRAVLQAGPPSWAKPGFAIYDTKELAGVDHERLVYFGASVFWRAGIKDWHLVEASPRLNLGPYEEQLRRFLLTEAPFPNDAALVLSVSPENDVRASAMGLFPYYKNHTKDWRQYNFTMNGLTFDFFVGRSMAASYRAMCLLRGPSHPVFMTSNMDAEIVRQFGRMLLTAKTVGKLGK